MHNNKIILLLLFVLPSLTCFSQNEKKLKKKRGEYSLVSYIGGGFSQFGSHLITLDYLQPVVSRVKPVGTLRIMWHPDHLLRIGVETGYLTFYSYRFKDSSGKTGNLSFNAVPLLIEYSMAITRHFSIFAGSGIYILSTKLDYAGKSSTHKLSEGWMAAASYNIPLTKKSRLGAELKWLYAAETSNGSFCLQLQYAWEFLKW